MRHPTYKEQYDKITRAYFRNEIEPYLNCACFIGNLLNNTDKWNAMRDCITGNKMTPVVDAKTLDPVFGFYTIEEICEMENNFLDAIENYSYTGWENSVFYAMSSTLDMLRKIHESKGEITEVQSFTKRQLV